jgi:hypothetical protein
MLKVDESYLGITPALLNEAANPETPVATLTELYRSNKPEILKALAENPGTPEELLFGLWESYPNAFLNNPITDLWLLLGAFAIEEKIPMDTKLKIYMHLIDTGEFCAHQIFFPVEQRKEYALTRALKTCRYHSWRKNNSSNKYDDQMESYLAVDPSENVRVIIAANTVQTELISLLSKDTSENVKKELAKNPKAPAAILFTLAFDKNEKVRAALAGSPSVDSNISQILSNDVNMVVALLAANPKACHRVLEKLIHHNNPEIRQTLAKNPSLNYKKRIDLLKDVSPLVSSAAVIHYKGLSQVFWQMALNISSVSVRETLVSQSGIPGKFLKRLAKDPSVNVRQRLVLRLRTNRFQQSTKTNKVLVDILSRDPEPKIRADVLNDYRISSQRLRKLIIDPEEEVRLSLAKRIPRIDLHNYQYLAIDDSPKVRLAAAKNMLLFGHAWGTLNQSINMHNFPHLQDLEKFLSPQTQDICEAIRLNLAKSIFTPAKTLNELVNDPSGKVKKALLNRNTFPRDVYIKLAQRSRTKALLKQDPGFGLTVDVLRYTSNSNNAYVRAMTARNGKTPISLLRKLANDKCWLVRKQLARNPRCPKDLINKLSNG